MKIVLVIASLAHRHRQTHKGINYTLAAKKKLVQNRIRKAQVHVSARGDPWYSVVWVGLRLCRLAYELHSCMNIAGLDLGGMGLQASVAPLIVAV